MTHYLIMCLDTESSNQVDFEYCLGVYQSYDEARQLMKLFADEDYPNFEDYGKIQEGDTIKIYEDNSCNCLVSRYRIVEVVNR